MNHYNAPTVFPTDIGTLVSWSVRINIHLSRLCMVSSVCETSKSGISIHRVHQWGWVNRLQTIDVNPWCVPCPSRWKSCQVLCSPVTLTKGASVHQTWDGSGMVSFPFSYIWFQSNDRHGARTNRETQWKVHCHGWQVGRIKVTYIKMEGRRLWKQNEGYKKQGGVERGRLWGFVLLLQDCISGRFCGNTDRRLVWWERKKSWYCHFVSQGEVS